MNEPLDAVHDALGQLRAHRTNMLAARTRDMLRLGAWLRCVERAGDPCRGRTMSRTRSWSHG